jgi:DNA-binding IclR family transcriptional regulator
MKTKTEVSSTVLRAIKILNHLHECQGMQSLSSISQELGISTTIVHRLLATLKTEGLVFQDPSSKLYTLGTIFLNYANKIISEMPIAPVMDPWLTQLKDLTQETVGFYVLSGQELICKIEHESPQDIRHRVGVGRHIPIYRGASGRAMLAFQPSEIQDRFMHLLSPTERQVMKQKLIVTKVQGYSINEEELTPNVGAISVPVYNHKQHIIGTLSISGPLYRWNKKTMEPFIPQLLAMTSKITDSFKSMM